MGFITKNANLLLLMLIVLAALGLVGATVYFQNNFSRINAEYNSKLSELKKISKDLDDQKNLLDQVSAELQLKTAREAEIGGKYTEKVAENVELTGEKKTLEGQVTTLGNNLQTAKATNLRLESENYNLQSQMNSMQGEINRLERYEDLYNDARRDASIQAAKASCLLSTDDANEGSC